MKNYYSLLVILLVGISAKAQNGMGIGNNNPQEMLDVTGAIKIGNTANTNAGAIRWTGADFEGRTGSGWVSLTGGGGTDDQNLTGASFIGNTLTIDIESGNSLSIDLSQFDDDTDDDADPTNELQTLSLSGTDVTLSNGGGTVSVADSDNDSANEIQDLSLSGTTLSLSGDATTVDLSGFTSSDNQNLTLASLTGSLLTIDIENGDPVNVNLASLINDTDADATNEIQDLSLSGDVLSLSGDATTVDLSSYDDSGTDDQTATEVVVTPNADLVATDVQGALEELQSEIVGTQPTIADVLGYGNDANQGQQLNIDRVSALDGDGLLLTDDGNSGLFIEDGGYVGIGTTDPSVPFEINEEGLDINVSPNVLARFEQATTAKGAGIQVISYRNSANPSAFIDLNNFTAGNEYITARISGYNNAAGEEGSLLFYTNAGGSTNNGLTERMRIDEQGYVGIGTSSPTTPLEVKAEISIVGVNSTSTNDYSVMALAENGTTTGFIGQWGSAVSTGTYPGAISSDVLIGNTSGAGISFTTTGDFGSEIRIDNAGHMGIGTILPSARLHIVESGNDGAIEGLYINESNAGQALTIEEAGNGQGILLTESGNGNGMTISESGAGVGLSVVSDDIAATFTGNVTATRSYSGWGIVPVGTILPWHKSFSNTPTLPDGWVECNGATVSDADSPYNGQTVPNLNNTGRFLRGSNTSGTLQNDELRSHSHSVNDPGHSHGVSYDGSLLAQNSALDLTDGFEGGGLYGPSQGIGGVSVNASTSNISVNNSGGAETRPTNMSVVWIIRIK